MNSLAPTYLAPPPQTENSNFASNPSHLHRYVPSVQLPCANQDADALTHDGKQDSASSTYDANANGRLLLRMKHAEDEPLDLRTLKDPSSEAEDASTVAEAAIHQPELAIQQLLATYNAAIARVIAYDGFLWSTPGVTLAAHAFLFSVALAGVNSQAARIISMSLSVLISFIIHQVFARHRQAEVSMSLWLAAFERRHFSVLKQEDHLHSRALHLKHRLEHERTPDGLILPLISTYAIWQSAILIIGLVACATLIMSCVRDDLFHSPR